MENILEWSISNNLNLIEVCIIVQLEKAYPQTFSIEEMVSDTTGQQIVKKNMHSLVAKGFVEQRFDKYRIKDNTYGGK
ncbi:hypothetical protein GCM10011409_19290 [Lentibacillus populi]|uniref:Uncharacterized protein n=1 Tax=Lentibacillus populi TaxID=1827502 RepID=A0A9W5TY89_9BACI|nr:hypothetical protein [Lentibacillus populi]GGB41891.1 hypothetical protein GCM10011409_19290 [Lentibacillus populi]